MIAGQIKLIFLYLTRKDPNQHQPKSKIGSVKKNSWIRNTELLITFSSVRLRWNLAFMAWTVLLLLLKHGS
jgi:hypothetical protein